MIDSIKSYPSRNIVILTGELSGEIHGSRLISVLKEGLNFKFSGMGSERLREEGVDIIFDYREISLIGISELFKRIPHIVKALSAVKKHLRDTRPCLLILVDFPGFNLRIAKYAKSLNIPVVYFIPPQIWAWHKGRIEEIKKYVDLVICILPFEKRLYEEYGIEARFSGHPFMLTVKPQLKREEFLNRLKIKENAKIITIMPGSRINEIKRHMPVMINAVNLLKKSLKNLCVVLPVADNIPQHVIIDEYLTEDEGVLPIRGLNYDALYHCDAAIIASGSATLEAAILGTPAVVIYKISPVSYFLARLLVDVKHISLPNIILEKELYPELIQDLNPEKIAEKTLYMLNSGREGIKGDIDLLKAKLGKTDAYRVAAGEIKDFLMKKYGTLS